MITLGLDIGSITAKAAVLRDGEVVGTLVCPTGYNAAEAGGRAADDLLTRLGLTRDLVDRFVSTGYGRRAVDFVDRAVTEIICHGAGAAFLRPGVRGVIDIGGQDSKALAVDENGKVTDFVMNDKCAAGTGRFLEVMAAALSVDLDDLGDLSGRADEPAPISSICTVFAESEVISLISRGAARENIIAGLHEAAAARVGAMAKRVGMTEPILMTGGVAKNQGVVRALEKKLNASLEVLESAQVNGAVGAAVIASREKV